jgi:hypothetical protein
MMFLCSGCTPGGPVDDDVEEALNALLLTEEFTDEEREAVNSISVHNEECKVWLKTGFSDDSQKITEVAEHIAKAFAEEFYNVAMEKDYKQPKYNIEVWIKASDDKGSFKALVCEWFFDLQRDRVDGENYGIARYKEIR